MGCPESKEICFICPMYIKSGNMQKHQESWRHIRKSEIVNRRKAKAKIRKKRERREKEILETRQDSEQEMDTETIPLSKRTEGLNKRKKSTDRNVGRKKARVTSVDSPEVTNITK